MHRPEDTSLPKITARYLHETITFHLKESHITRGPYFHLYDEKFFKEHILPDDIIITRYEGNKVPGKIISQVIENFLQEVQEGKSKFTAVDIIKKRDFDSSLKAGLIVARCKQYPFIIKLFIETPQSFTKPLDKGFEPMCFFMLGGGSNRHMTGFTRIKNLHYLKEQVSQNPYWKDTVDFPRKWYWLPKNPSWLELTGHNLDTQPLRTVIPAVYALVGDYIHIERTFSIKRKNDRRLALSLSNYLHQNIDPHINNFVIEEGTHKIILLDTEHFPSMVGYQDPPLCASYVQWYTHLSSNALRAIYGRPKNVRLKHQYQSYVPCTALRS